MNAIVFTAYDRPSMLRSVLQSWEKVRGIHDWFFIFRIEPSPREPEVRKVIRDFTDRTRLNAQISTNHRVLGVLHHPWAAFEDAFRDFEFVVRAEDDLRVSDDILDYFTWAELTYRQRPDVATIHAYTDGKGVTPHGVHTLPAFNPWIWGTWRHQWQSFMRDTWDHDYSTFNETPGHNSGWDWNLDTRIFPERGLVGVYPKMSRVDNIGVIGTHSTPENWRTASTFRETFGVIDYRET